MSAHGLYSVFPDALFFVCAIPSFLTRCFLFWFFHKQRDESMGWREYSKGGNGTSEGKKRISQHMGCERVSFRGKNPLPANIHARHSESPGVPNAANLKTSLAASD